jgi:hypothetical protein
MIRAPEKKRSEVPMTEPGVAMGIAIGAAMRVEKRHGKNR